MSVIGSVSVRAAGTLFGTADLGRPRFDFELARTIDFVAGTGPGQANIVWSDVRTLAASANEDIDLSGVLAGHLGGTIAFTAIKGIIVRAGSGNTNNVVIGNAASNGFLGPLGAAAHTIAVPPGGIACLAHAGNGWSVTAGTGDLLRFANSGAGSSVEYHVVIIGH